MEPKTIDQLTPEQQRDVAEAFKMLYAYFKGFMEDMNSGDFNMRGYADEIQQMNEDLATARKAIKPLW